MIAKILDIITKFNNTLWMLLCVLIFAMTGSCEGMLVSGVFAFILLVVEVCNLVATKRKRRKE